MYLTSSRTRSSKESLLRPETCQRPVKPGSASSRSVCQSASSPAADAGDARVVHELGVFPDGDVGPGDLREQRLGVGDHRAELAKRKASPAAAGPLLGEENWSGRIELDRERNQQHQGYEQRQRDQ